jgi:hypothetical protein
VRLGGFDAHRWLAPAQLAGLPHSAVMRKALAQLELGQTPNRKDQPGRKYQPDQMDQPDRMDQKEQIDVGKGAGRRPRRRRLEG